MHLRLSGSVPIDLATTEGSWYLDVGASPGNSTRAEIEPRGVVEVGGRVAALLVADYAVASCGWSSSSVRVGRAVGTACSRATLASDRLRRSAACHSSWAVERRSG